jgi:uncharacterized membrane protein
VLRGTEAARREQVELSLGSNIDAVLRQPHTLEKSADRIESAVWVVGAALVGLFIKLTIAYNTFGTNDVVTFYMFARSISEHGLEWTYRNGFVFFSNYPVFNHPPLTAYYLELIGYLSRQHFFQTYGVTFPFLLRVPGIIADFVVVLVLLRVRKVTPRFRIPTWALLVFALSPVSIMVSGFHGNTDSVMVMFFMLAAYTCLRDRPVLCGIFFVLSCQIKVIPLLFFPVILFWWSTRRRALRFALPFLLLTIVLWIEPLTTFPLLFLKNVLSYGSYWGDWGITYCLRLTRLPAFNGAGFFNLPRAAVGISLLLKAIIVAAVIVIGWRRRHLPALGVVNSIAYSWVIFFIFSPAVCPQYMVWLAPFLLILSPTFYACFTATSSIFLFLAYNSVAGGLPWFIAIAKSSHGGFNWSLISWVTVILGAVLFWKRTTTADSSLHLFSFKTLPLQTG